MSFLSSLQSAASSFISTSNISSNYTLASSLPSTNPNSSVKIITIGIWKVERAVHNTNNKIVSIWTADKALLVRGKSTGSSGNPGRGEIAVEVLKKEVSIYWIEQLTCVAVVVVVFCCFLIFISLWVERSCN